MDCFLQRYARHQFTYIIYYSHQDMFKNSRNFKIDQVHQKLPTKQFILFCLTCFLFVRHLNLKQHGVSGEPRTQYTRESHTNVNYVGI